MNLDKKKIRVALIIEVLGKPAEHLTETLNDITKKIDKEKGIEVVKKKINEPKELEDKKGFYTNFAEIEVEVENPLHIAVLVFKYMPAHIDIISPEKLSLANNDFTDLFNELTRRLHSYDEVARVLQFERAKMIEKLKELGWKPEDKKEGGK